MRILFKTIRSDNLVNLNVIYYLEKEISKLADCQWAGEGWKNYIAGETLSETVKRLYGNDPPDWIIFNRPNLFEYESLRKTQANRDYRIALTLTDLHVEPKRWVDSLNETSDVTLMRYLYSPYIVERSFFNKRRSYKKFDPEFYQNNLTTQVYHYPWFTDLNIYQPQEGKELDVIFLGSWGKRVYPLRNRIVKDLPKLSKKKKWRCLIKGRPPGHTTMRNIDSLKKDGYLVGDKYADIIARSKIFIFGNSIFDYPISKYFEIMGSRTLVMADKPQTIEDLHFIPGVNFIEINRDNWTEKLEYYLKNDDERERVAQNGYDTVLKYHSSKIRAEHLISYLKEADRILKN